MKILNLTSSRFFGGPERQMLGLAEAAKGHFDTTFGSFSENNLCREFLKKAEEKGFDSIQLKHDTPRLFGAFREIRRILKEREIDILICHGYKAGLIGWLAARSAGLPVVSVSRGWTADCHRVRLYEWLDRRVLGRVDRVVCVSQSQADKVLAAGVQPDRVRVIRNAISIDRFHDVDQNGRERLIEYFPVPERGRIKRVIGAAGRLSPEKGFDLLVQAARNVLVNDSEAGIILFGDGQLRETLNGQIQSLGISNRFVLAGFCNELDQHLPHLDLFVQSSHTEGLPNVLLESLACGVPCVATDVGGTREVLVDGVHGRLVPAADADAIAQAILELFENPELMLQMSRNGKTWIAGNFTFSGQVQSYLKLFEGILPGSSA